MKANIIKTENQYVNLRTGGILTSRRDAVKGLGAILATMFACESSAALLGARGAIFNKLGDDMEIITATQSIQNGSQVQGFVSSLGAKNSVLVYCGGSPKNNQFATFSTDVNGNIVYGSQIRYRSGSLSTFSMSAEWDCSVSTGDKYAVFRF